MREKRWGPARVHAWTANLTDRCNSHTPETVLPEVVSGQLQHPQWRQRRRWPMRAGSQRSLAERGRGEQLVELARVRTLWLPGSGSRHKKLRPPRHSNRSRRRQRQRNGEQSKELPPPWRPHQQQQGLQQRQQQSQKGMTLWRLQQSWRTHQAPAMQRRRQRRGTWHSSERQRRQRALCLTLPAGTCGMRPAATTLMPTRVGGQSMDVAAAWGLLARCGGAGDWLARLEQGAELRGR